MSKSRKKAEEIMSVADELGWDVEIRGVRGDILTIHKRIRTETDFVRADGEHYMILGLLPQTGPGSMWGTDGSGVGAVSAMRKGLFTMNMSGGSKLVLRHLAKMI